MNALRTLATALRAGCALALLVGTAVSEAQTPSRSVHAVPQPAAPPVQSLPKPSGLESPIPSPGGLTSQFPSGLPPPHLPTADVTPPVAPTPPPPFTGGGGSGYPGAVPQTSVMGAGGYGSTRYICGSGPYTPLQIAQSFLSADANRDGELTRSEAHRLAIRPCSFEEADRDFDGILTRFEYEDSVR